MRTAAIVHVLNSLLNTLSGELNRDSLNYTVSLFVFSAPGLAGSPLAEIVASGLGRAVIVGEFGASTSSDVLQEFNFGMDYLGNHGSHPTPGHLDRPTFAMARARAQELLERELAATDAIFSFWLKSGHPFYPVFWDFAFLMEQGENAYIFIGSSSD